MQYSKMDMLSSSSRCRRY